MTGLSWHTVVFPPDLPAEAGEQWLRSLSARRLFRMVSQPKPVLVEVSSVSGRLSWRLALPDRLSSGVLADLRGIAPGVQVGPLNHPGYQLDYGWELRLSHPFVPLRTDVPEQISTGLLHALAATRAGEELVFQWAIGGAVMRRRVKNPAQKQPSDPLAILGDLVADRDDLAALKLKQAEPVFACLGRIAVAAATRPRERELVAHVFGALELARTPGAGFQRRLIPPGLVARRMRALVVPWGAWPCALNASELTGLLGIPYEGPVLSGVEYHAQRQLPPSNGVLVPLDSSVTKGRVFGQATFPGREGLLVQRPADSLLHTWTLGPSGQGKSTLLGNLVLQDAAQGRGVICIDPKGDLVRDIVARLDPKRLEDVVLLDAGDPVAVVGVNPLRGVAPAVAADTLLGVLKGLFGDNFGPRTADVVHAGLLTLAHDPQASLVNLPILLTDRRYQQRLVPKASKADPWGLAGFWAWYQSLGDDQRTVVLAPIMNKLRSILLRGSLRRVLGQAKPRFLLRQVFTERKILLVSLASGAIGSESAALLGSVLVSMVWQEIQQRTRVVPERRRPVSLVVDEFQNYLHLPTDFADVLAQARGLGVGVVAAHQHLGQLTPTVRSALLANAQSRVLFRLAAADASVFAKTGRLLDAAAIEGLGRYETYISLVSDGAVTAYASARTLPLPNPVRDPQVLVERSRARWACSVEDIDTEHRELSNPSRPTQPDDLGPRRRTGTGHE